MSMGGTRAHAAIAHALRQCVRSGRVIARHTTYFFKLGCSQG
eukprot:SAG31_NODE_25551_length_459_cov_0.955556_1_plen_41_part_10